MATTQQPQHATTETHEEARESGLMSQVLSATEQARRDRNALSRAQAQIATLSWGRNMDDLTRLAFAHYAVTYGLDPLTELENMAGSPYPTVEFYLRKLGELRRTGVIAGHVLDNIAHDPRLVILMNDETMDAALRDEARQENTRRLMERIRHNVPEEAEAAVACRLLMPEGPDIIGVKWAGNGTSVKQHKSGGPAAPNPIAEGNAQAYSESTSVRRAVRQLASHVPDSPLARELAAMDADSKAVKRTAPKREPVAPVKNTEVARVEYVAPPPSEDAAKLHASLQQADPYTGKMPLEQPAEPATDSEPVVSDTEAEAYWNAQDPQDARAGR